LGTSQSAGLSGSVAVITGAGGGIGRAIAMALGRQGISLCLVGRNQARLAETAAETRQLSEVAIFPCDLNRPEDYQALREHLNKIGRLDILIHAAGVIQQASMECARLEDFDLQYATNVRAPYALTQRLLPLLALARGQIVFLNSSAGLSAKRPEIGAYAASKHALKAVADSLREEVNSKGIRVLTVYLGRTATPMQQALHKQEGRAYRPESLMQPEDVAAMVTAALSLPRTAEVTDISMRPMEKSY
jgi:NADP-dependent 3-hydroxy acid dehydrogenase YdfG